jgi:hypothetical protein
MCMSVWRAAAPAAEMAVGLTPSTLTGDTGAVMAGV